MRFCLLVLCVAAVLARRPIIVFNSFDGLQPQRTTKGEDGKYHASQQYLQVSPEGRHTGLFYDVKHEEVFLLDDDDRVQSVDCEKDTELVVHLANTATNADLQYFTGLWPVDTILVGSHTLGCTKQASERSGGATVAACVYRVVTGALSINQHGHISVPCRQATFTEMIPEGGISFYTNDGLKATRMQGVESIAPVTQSGAFVVESLQGVAQQIDQAKYSAQGFFGWLWGKITGAVKAVWDDLTSFAFDHTYDVASYKFNTLDGKSVQRSYPFDNGNGDVSGSLSCSQCFADFDLTLRLDMQVTDASVDHMALTLDGSANLAFVVTADLSVQWSDSASTHLTTVGLPDITFFVGYIPILLQPSIPVDAGVSASVAGSGTAQVGLKLSNDIQVGLSYPQPPSYWPDSDQSDDDGVHVLNYDQGWQVTPVASIQAHIGASLTVYLSVGLDVTVDVVLSVGVYAKPSLTLSFSDAIGSSPVFTLDGGLDVFIQGSVFVVKLGDPLTLYSTTFPLWKSDSGDSGSRRRLLALPGSLPAVSLHAATPRAVGNSVSAARVRTDLRQRGVPLYEPAPTSSGSVVDVTRCPDACNGHGQCWDVTSAAGSAVCKCNRNYYGASCQHKRADEQSKECTFSDGCQRFDSFQTCSHLNGLPICASSNVTRLAEQDAQIGALFSAVQSTQPTSDPTLTDDISAYAFLKPQGPVCMDNMLALMCSQAFPSCGNTNTISQITSTSTLVKTCHSDCVATFQSCGGDSTEAARRCNAMASSSEQHMAKKTAKSCAPLPTVTKSVCTMASGLSTCSVSNGRYVSLDSLLFSSLQEADSYVAEALTVVANSRFSACPQSAAILLCSQFLPECSPEDGGRLRMCHSTCADAIWNCNFDGVHNFSNACDGVGLASLSGTTMSDGMATFADASLSDSLSSYVATYVAPAVSSAIDPTASVCGYSNLVQLTGVTLSRVTTQPGGAAAAGGDSSEFSKSVFVSSIVIAAVIALVIGGFVGWIVKGRLMSSSQSRDDIAMEQGTGYRPLTAM